MGAAIYQQMTLRDYLRVVFRHKVVIIISVVILMLIVYINMSLNTISFSATVLMMKEGDVPTEAEYYSDYRAASARLMDIELVKSSSVMERTVRRLKLYNRPIDYEKNFSSKLKAFLIDYKIKNFKRQLESLTPEKRHALLFSSAIRNLMGSIYIAQVKDVNMFTISVTDFSPTAAVVIANVVSRAYVIYDLERQLAEVRLKYGEKHTIARQVKEKINELKKYLDGRPLTDIEAIGPASVKIIGQAKEASPIIRYNKRLVLTLTFVASVIFGILLAYGFEFLDQTIKSPIDVETVLNIPFLGSIPKRKSEDKMLINNPDTTTNYALFYWNLSDHLELIIKDKNLKSILITNIESSEDSAAVIANVSICLARKEPNLKVLIIDANLRNPSIYNVFNITNNPGLADVLEGKILFEDAVQLVNSNLNVLTAGKTGFNPATLFSSLKISEILKTAKEEYEIVLLACADLKYFTDSVILSSLMDAIILVINEGKVRRQVVKFAIAPLEQKKANLIGVILNNRSLVIPKMIYDRL